MNESLSTSTPECFQAPTNLVEIFFREPSVQLRFTNEKHFDRVVCTLDNYSSLHLPFSRIPLGGPASKHRKELAAATKRIRANSTGSVLRENEVLSASLNQLAHGISVRCELNLMTAIKDIGISVLSEDLELVTLATRYSEGYLPNDFD